MIQPEPNHLTILEEVLPPNLMDMAAHHFKKPGKGLRESFTLSCLTPLMPVSHAKACAKAIEFIHNGTLIHDDIQDGDTHRRGQETVWKRFGIGDALNFGSALYMAGIDQASRSDDSQIVRLVTQALNDTIAGQVLETQLSKAPSWELYNQVCALKTGPLFRVTIDIALHLNKTRDIFDQDKHPMMLFGRYFQLMDDLIDLYGQKGREAPGKDIDEGKISALVLATCDKLQADEREDFLKRLRQTNKSQAQKSHLIAEINEAEAGQFVHQRAIKLEKQILDSLELIFKNRDVSINQAPIIALLDTIKAYLAQLELP